MTDKPWRDKYLDNDPLSDIQPGLLNSQEIRKYADLELLVSEFDENRLKSASYEMKFRGELHSWYLDNGRPKKRTVPLDDEGEKVTLQSNSITYISLQEEFRLPLYIAARFNLHIRHVHKGLLLGTGPLVDPGFDGRLLVPLHNLTENAYEIEIGDGLIWVEFTKLNAASDKKFPADKLGLGSMDYFERAGVLKAGGVLSSIETTMETSRKAAAKQTEFVTNVRRISLFGGAFALVTFVLSVVALFLSAHQLSLTSQQISTDSAKMLQKAESTLQVIQAIITQEDLGGVGPNGGVTQLDGSLSAQPDDTAPSAQPNAVESGSEIEPAASVPEEPPTDLEEPPPTNNSDESQEEETADSSAEI